MINVDRNIFIFGLAGLRKIEYIEVTHGPAMPTSDAVFTIAMNLLPDRVMEKFWDALWLGIRPFLCFIIMQAVDVLKLDLLPNRVIENFWDALWLGIWPFLCFKIMQTVDVRKLNLLPNRVIENFWDALWLGIRPFLCFITCNHSFF